MNICCHCIITGRVQGVYYRVETRKTALALNLTGWVRNVDDGNVETIVCGTKDIVDDFIKWLWQGPPAAKVDNVVIKTIAWQEFKSFEIR